MYICHGRYRGYWNSTPPGLIMGFVITTTGYTVAIGIECLRHSIIVMYICHGRYRGYWNSTPPGLILGFVITTTGYTVAIGIECLRHSIIVMYICHGRYRGYWNSTPPGLILGFVITTTGYTVAIGIECLRHSCNVIFSQYIHHYYYISWVLMTPEVSNPNSHSPICGSMTKITTTPEGLNKILVAMFCTR